MRNSNIVNVKKIAIVTLAAVCTLHMPAWSISKEDAINLINLVQSELNEIQANPDFKESVPFDVYNDIVLNIISASIHLKDKDYEKAYWYGQISSIKLETLKTLTEAKMIEQEYLMKLQKGKPSPSKGPSLDDIPLSRIMNANLQRKGSTFRIDLLDKDIFAGETFKLTAKGKEYLNKLIEAINAFSNSKISVVGHTRWEDYKKYSKWKAKIIFNYLTDNGIDPGRIEYLGVGNRVVMDTPWGFKRISRVEIILYGIELQ